MCTVINTLISESDQHLISPLNITLESNIKVMRIKEMIINGRIPDWQTNSFFQHTGKCVENGMENMHIDVRM